MNWKLWTALLVVLAATAAFGALEFLSAGGGDIPEPSSTHVTGISVDLERPYQGTVTVTYPLEGVSDDDFQVVVGAREDVHELLKQYFVPYEDPHRVRVDRGSQVAELNFSLIARDRLEFLFPEIILVGSWLPLWESMGLTLVLPAGYEVTETSQESLEDLEVKEIEGRWTVSARALGTRQADFTVGYAQIGVVPRDRR